MSAHIKWNSNTNVFSADIGNGVIYFINNDSALFFFKNTLGMCDEHVTDMLNTLITDSEYITEVA